MSIVYRARDADLGEEVALKFLTGGLLDAEADERFKLELKLSRQLVHPNIARLYDLGQHDELRFISMELLSGRDLARILRGGPLPPDRAVGHLLECCAALQAAHDRGIIHRDVKPANLFVTNTGDLKVMDFGIAKLQKGGPALTSVDLVAGTPTYLAPEQIRGFSSVTPAADSLLSRHRGFRDAHGRPAVLPPRDRGSAHDAHPGDAPPTPRAQLRRSPGPGGDRGQAPCEAADAALPVLPRPGPNP